MLCQIINDGACIFYDGCEIYDIPVLNYISYGHNDDIFYVCNDVYMACDAHDDNNKAYSNNHGCNNDDRESDHSSNFLGYGNTYAHDKNNVIYDDDYNRYIRFEKKIFLPGKQLI